MSRDANIDAARGLGLALMIYSHFILFADGTTFELVARQWQVGATWRMPFLFFVSGLAHAQLRNKDLRSVLRGALTLYLMALAASVIAFAVLCLVDRSVPPDAGWTLLSYLLGGGYQLGPVWFLSALAVVRILAWLVLQTPPGVRQGAAVAAMVVGLYVLVVPQQQFLPMQGQTLPAAFAFFMLGVGWSSGHGGRLLWLLPVAVLAPLLNGGCPGDPFSVCPVDPATARIELPYFAVSLVRMRYGFEPLFALGAVAAAAMLWRAINLMPADHGLKRSLGGLGRNALQLLVVHCVVLLVLRDLPARLIDSAQLWQVVGWCLVSLLMIPAHELLRRLFEPWLLRLQAFVTATADALIPRPAAPLPA